MRNFSSFFFTLASVVAGMIGSYKNNGVLTDADTATETGVYRIYGKVNCAPLSYGVLSVDNTGTYIQQIASASGVGNPPVYLRTRNSDSWSAWQRIDNFGCNTLEELAAALKPLL